MTVGGIKNGPALCVAEVLTMWCCLTSTTRHWTSCLSCTFCHVKSSTHPFCTRVLPHANNVIQASPRSGYGGQCTQFETISSLWEKPRPPRRRRQSEDKATWRVGPSLRFLHIGTWVIQNVKNCRWLSSKNNFSNISTHPVNLLWCKNTPCSEEVPRWALVYPCTSKLILLVKWTFFCFLSLPLVAILTREELKEDINPWFPFPPPVSSVLCFSLPSIQFNRKSHESICSLCCYLQNQNFVKV